MEQMFCANGKYTNPPGVLSLQKQICCITFLSCSGTCTWIDKMIIRDSVTSMSCGLHVTYVL